MQITLAEWRDKALPNGIRVDLICEDEIIVVVQVEDLRACGLVLEELCDAEVLLVYLGHHERVGRDGPLVIFAGMLGNGLLQVHKGVGNTHGGLILHDLVLHTVGQEKEVTCE